jgi:hypothetical protein
MAAAHPGLQTASTTGNRNGMLRWCLVPVLALGALWATQASLQSRHPDPLAALRPYMISEDVRTQGMPFGAKPSALYGSRFRTISIRGLTNDEIVRLLNAEMDKEGGWNHREYRGGSGQQGYHAFVYEAYKGASENFNANPTLSITRNMSTVDTAYGNSRVHSLEQDERGTTAVITVTEPLTRGDIIALRIRHFGGSPYGNP